MYPRIPLAFPDVKLFLGGFDQKVLATVDEIVLSPGISLKKPDPLD